jgi:hypothetical protein
MNDGLLGWAALVSGFAMLLSCFATIYVGHFILAKIEDQLKGCKVVTDAKVFWGNTGYVGKTQRYAMVYLALTATRRLSEKGMVDIDEVNRISIKSRRWICLPVRIGVPSFIIMCLALALLGKL